MYDSYAEVESELRNDPKPVFRFEKPFLGISTVGDQSYCEKKVELEIERGAETTQEMELGTEAHGNLLRDSESIESKKLWNMIFVKDHILCREFSVAAKIQSYPIIGRIDALYFHKSKPTLLLEHKFSSSSTAWDQYHRQARLYCLTLKYMGFDTSKLKYAIIVAPREARDDTALMDVPAKILKDFQREVLLLPLARGFAKVYVKTFDDTKAESELAESLDYWLGRRGARGSDSVGKCRSCKFNLSCDLSLMNPSR